MGTCSQTKPSTSFSFPPRQRGTSLSFVTAVDAPPTPMIVVSRGLSRSLRRSWRAQVISDRSPPPSTKHVTLSCFTRPSSTMNLRPLRRLLAGEGVLVLFTRVLRVRRQRARRRRLLGSSYRINWSAFGAWSLSPELVCHVSEAAKIPPPHTTAASREHRATRITPDMGITI